MRRRSPTGSAIVGDHTRLTATRSCAAYIRMVTAALSTWPHANMNVLPRIRRVGPTDDLVLAGLIGQPIADRQQHWKDTSCARWIGRRRPR